MALTNEPGQGVTTPEPLGEAVPQSVLSRFGSGSQLEGPDTAAQAAKVHAEPASIGELVNRVALQYPAASALAKDVESILQSMGQEILSTMEPTPGSIPEPPGL